jgi:chromosome segregation ATPase
MAAIEDQIKTVSYKLQQLLKQYVLLQKENGKLKEDVKKLQQNNNEQLNQIEQLQIQVSVLKAASSKMDDADKKIFERRITQYIKDIDKCITFLSE